MKLTKITKPNDSSVKETIEHFSTGDYDCVMLIGLNKDGSQWLETSRCSLEKKSLMLAFAQAYLVKLFNGMYEE